MVYETLESAIWSNGPQVLTPYSGMALMLDWNTSGGDTLDGHGDVQPVWWPSTEKKTIPEGKGRVGGGYVDRETGRYVLLSLDCDPVSFTLGGL